jgi:hypothetical protein
LRISAGFGQSRNITFVAKYDILAKAIAAQRLVASALLVAFGKCHERCGCVMFREIFDTRVTPESGLATTASNRA